VSTSLSREPLDPLQRSRTKSAHLRFIVEEIIYRRCQFLSAVRFREDGSWCHQLLLAEVLGETLETQDRSNE